MKTIELKVSFRETLGKGHAKRLRKQKRVPAILYGSKVAPVPLEVDTKDFQKALRTESGRNVILSLKISGAKKDKDHYALVKDIQIDPIDDSLYHIDFNAISLTEKIRVKVPLHSKGDAPGVKEGGVLEHIHREIEVECLPTAIPERFDLNVDQLQIGDSLHVSDIKFPEGVVSILGPDEVVLAMHAPMKEEVAAPAEGEASKEPEVIGKKKEEGEAAEGAAPAAAEKKAGGEKKE